MDVFGLTGGIAAGKSEVSRMLAERGCRIIDADRLAVEALAKNAGLLGRMVEVFGNGILTREGALNRKKAAASAFRDGASVEALNRLFRPVIDSLFWEKIRVLEGENNSAPVVFDAPLLFEWGYDRHTRKNAVVVADSQTVRSRLRKRNMDWADFSSRLEFQMSVREKSARADFIVENDGSLEDLENKAGELYAKFLLSTGGRR